MTDDAAARAAGILEVHDADRVRTLTMNRPDALNAFNGALYRELAAALYAADEDPGVAVVLLTGRGRAFSAGTDLVEMAELVASGGGGGEGDGDGGGGDDALSATEEHGFNVLVDALIAFSKPLVAAVNGLGLGIGVTLLGFVDLAFISEGAKLKCPFTSLGVAPEAASSFLIPRLVGHQNAAWVLLSSEWISAEQAHEMGLVWKLCTPDELMPTATEHATRLAALPVSSLRAVKRAMNEPVAQQVAEARRRENGMFAQLLGGPANTEALAAFAEGRKPDFTALPDGA